MPASATDLVRNAAPNFATTLANSMLISDTTMTLQSVTGLPTGTGITLTIDATDPVSGDPTPTLQETVTGVVSGSTVTNLVRGLDTTTQQAHASGANVVMWFTANDWNDWQASYLLQHNQAGTHQNITANNVTYAGTFTGVNGTVSSVYLTNPYKFSVYRNGAWTTATPGLVTFDTVTFDTGSNYSVSTGKFTTPAAGFYQFESSVSVASVAGANSMYVALYKNGSIIASGSQIVTGAATANNTLVVSALLQLATNDYVQVYYYGNSFTGGTGIYNTFFHGFLVSAT